MAIETVTTVDIIIDDVKVDEIGLSDYLTEYTESDIEISFFTSPIRKTFVLYAYFTSIFLS